MEKRAYCHSANLVKTVATVNELENRHTAVDEKALREIIKRVNYIEYSKNEIETCFHMPINEAVNMEMIHEYNTKMYGDEKSKYICKDLMQAREIRMIEFFNSKFKNREKNTNMTK